MCVPADAPLQGEDTTHINQPAMETNEAIKAEKKAASRTMLTGMFADRESAEKAYNTLHEHGYTNTEINLIMSDETRKKYFSDAILGDEFGSKVGTGAGAGSIIGGTVGAIVAITVAVGTSLFVPGLGLIIAGPIAAALAGAGAGVITGGILGALVGAGMTDETAKLYESGVKKGNIVMGVYPRNESEAEYLENNWKVNQAIEVHK